MVTDKKTRSVSTAIYSITAQKVSLRRVCCDAFTTRDLEAQWQHSPLVFVRTTITFVLTPHSRGLLMTQGELMVIMYVCQTQVHLIWAIFLQIVLIPPFKISALAEQFMGLERGQQCLSMTHNYSMTDLTIS